MSWLFLAVLGIIWGCIFLRGRGRSPATSVERFERGLGLLADTGRAGGRWIVAPRKGAQFIGARNRARARARGRRRRILTFLLEATGVTLLMALFPPLRPLMLATALFGLLLVLYLGMLLAVRRNERELGRMRRRVDAEVDRPASAHTNGNGHANGNGNGHGKGRRLPDRQVVAGNGRARPVYNGLDFYDQDEDVHVVVRTPPRAERVSSSRVASPVG